MKAQFPLKLQFLFKPCRYKILVGGRGGAKSWGVARALLLFGAQRKLRILCAREIQKSIADSVHALLKDQIGELGLSGFYLVQETRIIGVNGTEFIFAGLGSQTATSIKSLEGCDIAWVEEAQTVRKKSWELLIPTIRKEASEIWVSFNPDLPTDDTYKRFIVSTPPGAAVVWIGWKDNPWFPEVLRIEKDHLQATDPTAYENVWEGRPKSEVSGAIYAAELKKAREEGRICKVSIDRTRPVDTFWDLGYGDTNAIWFAQALPGGTFRLVDYEQGSGLTIADYVVRLQEKKYMYGTDYVPHDGVDAIIHHRLTGDKTKSPEMLLRAAGRKVIVAPKLHIATGINAARSIFPNCWFDEEKCADGIQGLSHYQWAPDTASGVQSRQPLHNWASHPADGFRTMAVSIKAPAAVSSQSPAREEEYSWMA